MTRHFLQFVCAILLAAPGAMGGPIAYVAGVSGQWGEVDLSSGLFNSLGTSGAVLNGMVEMPDGQYLGYDVNNNLDSIDPADGALTLIGSGGVTLDAIAVMSNGALFGVSRNTADLYSIDPATGATTLIGATGLGTGGGDDSFTSDGTNLYFTYEMGSDPAGLYLVNAATGNASLIGMSGGPELEGSGFIGGAVYGFGSDNNIYTVTTATGAATLSAALSSSLPGVNAAAPVDTPEPSTVGLMGLGLATMFWHKRRG